MEDKEWQPIAKCTTEKDAEKIYNKLRKKHVRPEDIEIVEMDFNQPKK